MAKREAEQTVVQSVSTANETGTTLSLSLTVSDKKVLKLIAAEQGTTIAAIIHGWIEEHNERSSYRWLISMRLFLKLQS